MKNKDLFKQAIAEAKSIRDAAIANAKTALEETLTPHIKDMLAAKLQEMEEPEIEEAVEEVVEEEVIDELSFSQLGEEEEDELPAEDELEGEEGLEDSEESEESLEEPIDLETMTIDDLKGLIKTLIAQEEEGELEGEEGLEGEEELPADDMIGAEDDEEEIDLDELLAELSGDGVTEETIEEDTPGFGVGNVSDDNALINLASSLLKAAKAGDKARAAAAFKKFGQFFTTEETIEEDLPGFGVGQITDDNALVNLASSLLKAAKAGDRARAAAAFKKFGQLLYVNKVFKANNLNETQKVNVITAFDKAETVKEVKLVFETVSKSESIKKVSTSYKKIVKEVSAGRASKPTGLSAKRPQIIAESAAVLRMQKLAGIL